MEFSRLFDILPYQKEKYPQPDALAKKENGQWITYSTDEVINHVEKLALGLIALGLKPGNKVAIISFNCPEWNFVDMALQQIGVVSVPMYPTITVDDYAYIFANAEVKYVFVQNEELYQQVQSATKSEESQITDIYTFEKLENRKHWTEVQQMAREEDLPELEKLKKAVKKEDLLTLIYTSGTTGKPKGVMITHANILSQIESCTPLLPVDSTARALSFLPLCHVYERMLSYLYMSAGLSIYYAESMETIGENLKEIKPHIFTTVPRLLEKVYDKIYAKGLDLTGIKKMLFFWALDLGLKYDVNKDQGFFYNMQLNLANKIIFNKWRDALGGNIRTIVSGSAALQPRLARVFWAAGIPVLEGYGLTETSPVIAVNRIEPKNHRIGTVGPVISNVEVKLEKVNEDQIDGEILTRGPHIMKGYYKMPEETEKAIDKDGWFRTGDLGTWQDGRFLKITGRIKEVFKTSGGKYVAPQLVENKFKESLLIEQIMVIGENQKFPAALIVPSFDNLKEWCSHKKITYSTDEEMIKHDAVKKKFDREVENLNSSFAKYEKIKQYRLLPKLWSIEDGELTPTLKCKRKVIMQRYDEYVKDIYQ